MSRIPPVQPETATGEAKELLNTVQSKMSRVPNLMKVLANSPAALNAYLQFSGAVTAGAPSAQDTRTDFAGRGPGQLVRLLCCCTQRHR